MSKDLLMDTIKLINFIDMTYDEADMVLKWRNNNSIKQWMFNQDEISLENHTKFVTSLKDRNDKTYFLVQQGDEYIGVIDFNEINNNDLKIGLYVNPSLRGVGKKLMTLIVKYAFDTLKVNKIFAEVFSNNSKAFSLYTKYNFVENRRKFIDNQEVICMELKSENR